MIFKLISKRKASLFPMLLVVFANMLSYGMIAPLLPLYAQNLGGDATTAGSLNATYALMQFVAGPALGALSDRYGRKWLLIACLLGTALSSALVAFAYTLTLLFVAVAIDGITGGNLTLAYAVVADITQPERRAHALAMAGAAFGFGVMAGPALGGWLSTYGLFVPPLVACGLTLINAAFAAIVLRESLPVAQRTTQIKRASFNVFAALARLFRMPQIGLVLGAIFIANFAFSGLQTNFPLFSQQRFNWSPDQIGYFFAFVGLCAVFAQGVLMRHAQSWLGEWRVAQIGLVAFAVGLCGIALAPSAWMLYPYTAVAALGSGLSLPTLSAIASNRTPANQQGALMGGTQTLFSVASIFAPLVAGALFVRVGESAPYVFGALCVMVAFALVFIALRRQ